MWIFSAVTLLLIVVVLAMILPKLLHPTSTKNTQANAERRAIFRGQFNELAQDKANGALSAAQYEVAKTELEHRMLSEIGSDATTVSLTNAKPDQRVALLLAVLIPFIAFAIYSKIGKPAAFLTPEILASNQTDTLAQAQVDALLASLKAQLEKNPNDAQGWAILARANAKLEKYDEAIAAFEKAAHLTPNDPQLLADYADTLAIANDFKLAGKPEALVQEALKIAPNHVKSLTLAGAAALERKDYAQAITLWQRLQNNLPPDAPILPNVTAAIAQAKAMAAEAEADKPAADKTAALVKGKVIISPALANQLEANATLFVYARAATGVPMPLAIVTATAKELPFHFQLDDTTAPMPQQKLSQADAVVIVARVSISGNAKPQTGDLQGVSSVIKPNGATVDIEINERIQ